MPNPSPQCPREEYRADDASHGEPQCLDAQLAYAVDDSGVTAHLDAEEEEQKPNEHCHRMGHNAQPPPTHEESDGHSTQHDGYNL